MCVCVWGGGGGYREKERVQPRNKLGTPCQIKSCWGWNVPKLCQGICPLPCLPLPCSRLQRADTTFSSHPKNQTLSAPPNRPRRGETKPILLQPGFEPGLPLDQSRVQRLNRSSTLPPTALTQESHARAAIFGAMEILGKHYEDLLLALDTPQTASYRSTGCQRRERISPKQAA